jgi:hypothetical protein
MKMLWCGARGAVAPPKQLTKAIATMLSLFAARGDPSVGGWALPYFVGPEGAVLCGYAYSVSDPIFSALTPGSILPHGTAERGGFGLSVTELGAREGVVVYWLQKPGGTIYRPTDEGFSQLHVTGPPSLFCAKASSILSMPVEVLFGDREPEGPLQKVSILRDDQGRPSVAVAHYDKSFTMSVINTGQPFHSTATLDLAPNPGKTPVQIGPVTVELAEDRGSVRLGLVEGSAHPITLTPEQTDALISALAATRSELSMPVSAEFPHEPGRRETLILDPAWRTEHSPHPVVSGIILRLRHLGHGWLGFVLPLHEARSLGTWLVNAAPVPDTASRDTTSTDAANSGDSKSQASG